MTNGMCLYCLGTGFTGLSESGSAGIIADLAARLAKAERERDDWREVDRRLEASALDALDVELTSLRTRAAQMEEALRAARDLCRNINEFGCCTDHDVFDATEALIEDALTKKADTMTELDKDTLDAAKLVREEINAAFAGCPIYPACLKEADGWRLMESAPKDGTEILAAIQVQKTDERNWWERHVIAFDEDLGEISGDYEHGWSWNDYTHWRPLPTPPEE